MLSTDLRMSRLSGARPSHGRTESYDDISAKTQVLSRSVGVDESLRSYKLLEGRLLLAGLYLSVLISYSSEKCRYRSH